MPNTSITTAAIRHISKQCAPALAARGFKRQAPHFYRLMPGGLYHAIQFQASRWGSRDAGSFTINLIVTSPWLYTKAMGTEFPKNPASALWPIQMRIGHFLPDARDTWWQVDAGTDIKALGAEIADALVNCALPFFDQYPDSTAILEHLRANRIHGILKGQERLISAILLAEQGQLDAARDTLLAVLRESTHGGYSDSIRKIAQRLGIELPSISPA